jgi:hypothetical protein
MNNDMALTKTAATAPRARALATVLAADAPLAP